MPHWGNRGKPVERAPRLRGGGHAVDFRGRGAPDHVAAHGRSGLATLCAYVLAGELALAHGDHRVAFAEYERAIRDTTKRCQKMAKGAGNFFAPPTEAKIRGRNRMYRMLRFRPIANLFSKSVTKAATAIDLKDYPA
jgi:hypothetical protein